MTKVELTAVKELFMITSLRGIDSTGLLYADTIKENKYRLMKDTGAYIDLTSGYPGWVESIKADLILGHCRWSTMGASTRENAHPYEFKKFVGMHNGTLRDLAYDPDLFKNSQMKWKAEKTDSFLFFHKLNQVLKDGGEIDDVVKDLKFSSAYAMILWDYIHTVSLFRNRDRTLFIGVSKENGSVFVASEERYLKFVENKKISFDIHEVETHKLYQIDMNEVGNSETPWTTTDLTKPEYPNSNLWNGYEDFWMNNYYTDDNLEGSNWYFDKELGAYREGKKSIVV